MKYFQMIIIALLLLCVACSNGESPIEQNQVVGKWVVTNDQVNMKKFTTKYGKIHVLEAMRVEQHFKEGMIVEFLSDGTVNFESVAGKYTLQSQEGYNYINLIGEASESSHPLELKNDKIQLSIFTLEKQ